VENSDNLNVVTVRGWDVVSNKEAGLKDGDLVVYFELDSMLPVDDPRFSFLASRSTRVRPDGTKVHVLKTARLRGQYSQGLVVPLTEFREEVYSAAPLEIGKWYDVESWAEHVVGVDMTDILGIEKYEAPLPHGGGADAADSFPTHLGLKTDSERVQNLSGKWDSILSSGPWYATEKVDGTSLSVFRNDLDEPVVCSRNWALKDGDNLYWRAVREHGLVELLYPFQGVQAEIYGPGIQGNPLGVNEVTIAVFAFVDHGKPVAREDWPLELQKIAAPQYADLTLADTVAGAVAQVDGIKSLISPARGAEGVVWHRVNPELAAVADDVLNGRHNFKAISNKYLLKHDG
jgi:RNA ligase (TIGR02306 family)